MQQFYLHSVFVTYFVSFANNYLNLFYVKRKIEMYGYNFLYLM